MQGIVATNWKKKILFGAGLLVLAVATIIMGIYSTFRADANQSLRSIPVLEETDMPVDEKAENVLTEPDSVTNSTGSDNSASSSSQQGESNSTNQNVEVRVDGETIDVPENGSVHKEINIQNGSASIDVSSQSNTSSGESRTRSSINVDVDSSTRIRNEIQE